MKLFYTLFLLFFGMTVQAAELSYAGVWKGSIGDNKLMVCFSSSVGAEFYYLRNLRGILLEPLDLTPDKDTTDWKETNGLYGDDQKITGFWAVSGISPGAAVTTLDLTWISPDGKKQIPFKLTKAPVMTSPRIPESDICGAAYYKPLEDDLPHTSKDLKFEGREYRSISTPAATVFELPASVPGSKNFNDYTRNWLKDSADWFYTCLRNGAKESDWGRGFEPLVWTDSKLVVKNWMSDIACDGSHGLAYEMYETFDLRTGKMIDTWTWVKQGDKNKGGENKQKTPLNALLKKLKNQKPERCMMGGDAFDIDDPYAGKSGMVFRLSHLNHMGLCEDTIIIPYKQMMPFLTPVGKAAVAEVLQP
ncbi:hypothetical protein ACO0K9_26260 [Undibacterium sp. Ji50W]|uniref:hypothetical protein n=1 Tax=Undibacterium sp. Ji50W TaxID=3413041 RepID=UPI003BF2B99A